MAALKCSLSHNAQLVLRERSAESRQTQRVSLKSQNSLWGSSQGSFLQQPIHVFDHGSASRVEMAISRKKKEATVEKAKEAIENCNLIAGINYKGFTVKQMRDLREKLPEDATLIVMKNTLLFKAIEGTKYEALKECMTGMNAFLFVHSEEIPPALKPFRDLQKELKLEENDYTGAVFEGKFYGPADFKALETMPSRAEIYAKLLGVMQQPATQLVTTLQAPSRELVLTLKAYVQKLEEGESSS